MKITFSYIWRRQALQGRCHFNLLSALEGRYRVSCCTVCGFLFQKLVFICYSCKVVFSSRSMFENKQICERQRCNLQSPGVCSSILSGLPPHPELCLEGATSHIKKTWLLRTLLCALACLPVGSSAEAWWCPAASSPGVASVDGHTACPEIAVALGGALLGGAMACHWVCVRLLLE